MKSRFLAVDSNIKSSELFPRIRDAEAAMEKKESLLRARLKDLKKKKKNSPNTNKRIPQPTVTTSSQSQNSFFSSFVLDKDPKTALYLPYQPNNL